MATPTITLNPNPPQRGRQAVFTVVWDEVVTGFTTLTNVRIFIQSQSFDGDVTFVAVSETTYTFTFVVPSDTPLGANIFFWIPTNSVDQGNSQLIMLFMTIVDPPPGVTPTIAFRQDEYDAGDTAIADITLDSSDITLLQSHLTVTGATISSFSGSGTAYVVNMSVPSTPEDGTIGLSIAEVEVSGTTLFAASDSAPYYTDAVITVSLPDDTVDAGTTQTATITANKVVSGLTIDDLSVNMGTLQNFRTTDNTTFMVDVVMPSTGAGTVTLTLAANSVTAGNAVVSDSIDYVTRGIPSVTFDTTYALHGAEVIATIVWNISVDDFVCSRFNYSRRYSWRLFQDQELRILYP